MNIDVYKRQDPGGTKDHKADDDKAKSQKNKNRRRIQSGAVCASAGRIRRDGRNLVLEAEKEERGVKKIRDFIKMKGFVTVV